ncbi:MAG TPA: hypothetical protein VEU33_07830 [Archangium sp.]|nr:hypothetical protein [Archangium sp.]
MTPSMKKTATSARFLSGLRRGVVWLPCLAFLGMWPFSYGFYTSLGLDTDRDQEGAVRRTHHRFRWPGDGSFWVGVPSWLPPLLLGLWPVRTRLRGRRVAKSPESR